MTKTHIILGSFLTITVGGIVMANVYSSHTSNASQAPRVRAAAIRTVPSFLTTLSKRMASQMGDNHPISGKFVVTTRRAANQLVAGAHVDSNPAVYLVVMQGQFIDRVASRPAGAKAPTGDRIVFTVTVSTHQILDFGITDMNPDMAKLGVVHNVL